MQYLSDTKNSSKKSKLSIVLFFAYKQIVGQEVTGFHKPSVVTKVFRKWPHFHRSKEESFVFQRHRLFRTRWRGASLDGLNNYLVKRRSWRGGHGNGLRHPPFLTVAKVLSILCDQASNVDRPNVFVSKRHGADFFRALHDCWQNQLSLKHKW